MKNVIKIALKAVIILILTVSPLFAEVLEPIKRVNISPVMGTPGTGMARILATIDKYDYEPDRTRSVTDTALTAEISIKLIDKVGIGLALPYHFIENQNLSSGSPSGTDGDENGLGNLKLGATVILPPPNKGVDFVVGANTTLPTADEDVLRKISTVEPYAMILTRDGDLSFTLSAAYDIIIDEQAPQGEPNDIYDNVLTAQCSAIYSANEIFSVGAQFVMTSAKNTIVEFIPQVQVAANNVEWGVAVTLPIADDHPQISSLEKSFGIMFDGTLRF